MSIVNIILTLSNLFLLLVFWAINIGSHKPKRGKIFGIRFPQERFKDERFTEILDWYMRRDRLWLWLAFVTAFTPLYPTQYFSITFSAFLIWTTWVVAYKITLFSRAMQKVRNLKSACGWTDPVLDADEQYWRGGVFYYNPHSKKIFTNAHLMGTGSTVNLATRGGKIFMIVTLLLLVVSIVPAWFLIIKDDFLAPAIVLTDDYLSVKSAFSKTTVDLDDIESIVLTRDVTIGPKSNGSSTALYKRGRFYVSGYGSTYVFIFNENAEAVLITLKDGSALIVNEQSPERTHELYRRLIQ